MIDNSREVGAVADRCALARLLVPVAMVLGSLACSYGQQSGENPQEGVRSLVGVAATIQPPSSSGVGTLGGFLDSDCAVPGVTFPSPYVGDQVTDEVFDGPSLICDSSTEGAHGRPVSAHIGITAYQADKLEGFYQQAVEGIRGFVDQANAWNALPDVPPDARFEITFIQNDNDGYIFMITSQANVYDCLDGSGYGQAKVEGKYLVNLGFQSCEGDAAAYTAALMNLRTAALAAIQRVETAGQK